MRDIVQVSNLFNVITQLHPDLKSYHFGWHSDINRNIDNNFDPQQETGKLFPHVQWIPPEGRLNFNDFCIEYECHLFFYDLQDYGNDSSLKTQTLLEQWRDLMRYAVQFLREFKHLAKQYRIKFDIKEKDTDWVKWDLDSHVHNDRLICVPLQFTLISVLECDDFKIDLTALEAPYQFPAESWDYEGYKFPNDSL